MPSDTVASKTASNNSSLLAKQWCKLAVVTPAIAADLVAWTRLLALTGDAAVLAACEPKAFALRRSVVPDVTSRGPATIKPTTGQHRHPHERPG